MAAVCGCLVSAERCLAWAVREGEGERGGEKLVGGVDNGAIWAIGFD